MKSVRPRGIVYLLHFERPYKHARHYIGWAHDLEHRLVQHRSGHGARLIEVIQDAGISWTLARTWPGTRMRERQIKRQGGASRHCPQCGVHLRQQTRDWTASELNRVARRLFALVDGDGLIRRPVLTYAGKRLSTRINNSRVITPADLLGWLERTTTMTQLVYTLPYVRADGSVWCMQEDTETGCDNACRMVVDIETGLTLFLPDYVVDVDAEEPTSQQTGEVWPLFRWATSADLHPVKR